MPLDPQCNQENECGELIGDGIKITDGCPKLCLSVKKKNFVDDDKKVHVGICDGDVYDELLDSTVEFNVYTTIMFGSELDDGLFLGYDEGVALLPLLTSNDIDKVLPGDIIESCNVTGGELLHVLEVGQDNNITVERSYLETTIMEWPMRTPVKLYRIFREEGVVNPDEGTLCYEWTQNHTATPGTFGAFAELTMSSGEVVRMPRSGAFKIIFV